jgi:hypothetical protein
MQNVRRFRAMGSLCRQRAAYNPSQSWKLLAEAEYWEHLALAETSSYFEECNADRSVYAPDTQATPNVYGSRWEPVASA